VRGKKESLCGEKSLRGDAGRQSERQGGQRRVQRVQELEEDQREAREERPHGETRVLAYLNKTAEPHVTGSM
jgi:hypothetical protein